MDTPFILHEDDILRHLHHLDEHENYLFIADETGVFEELLMQPLQRTVYDGHYRFLGIKNIVYHEQYRGQGRFTGFLCQLEALHIPIMIHDIINPQLQAFLVQRGYTVFEDERYDETITSCYLLPNLLNEKAA